MALWIKVFRGANQSSVSLLDQIVGRHPSAFVMPGDIKNQSEVRQDKGLACRAVAVSNPRGKLFLLFGGQQVRLLLQTRWALGKARFSVGLAWGF
jgi:hypothetical protein